MAKGNDQKQNDKWEEARRKALAYGESLTDEEDARITAAALADPDAQPISDEMWANALPYEEQRRRMKRLRGQRGPQKTPTKKLVSLRIDPDVLAYFRGTGPGWQARINEALRKVAGLG